MQRNLLNNLTLPNIRIPNLRGEMAITTQVEIPTTPTLTPNMTLVTGYPLRFYVPTTPMANGFTVTPLTNTITQEEIPMATQIETPAITQEETPATRTYTEDAMTNTITVRVIISRFTFR